MKKLIFIYLTACAIILASCGGGTTQKAGTTEKESTTEASKAQSAAKDNMLDREVMEAKLKEIGFPIYPGAEFEELKKTTSFFKGYYIQYNLPEVSSESKEAVAKFYEDVFEKMMESGWKDVYEIYWEKGDMLLHFGHECTDLGKGIHLLGITFGLKSKQ